MTILKSIETGIVGALENPLGACLGAAWWILCLGTGTWTLRGVLNFVFRINGLS